MTLTEAAKILTLAAAYDRRTLGDEDVRAWHAVLEHVAYPDARQAVIEHYRAQTTWLMPADVAAGVRRIRSDRLAQLDTLLPNADPDDVTGWLEAYRAQIADVADGRTPAPHPASLESSDRRGVQRAVAALAELKEAAAHAAARERAAQAAEDAERARQLAAMAELAEREPEQPPIRCPWRITADCPPGYKCRPPKRCAWLGTASSAKIRGGRAS
jgi:hypothetical protein